MTTIATMAAIVAGIWLAANAIVLIGSKICAARGHRRIENDEANGHAYCGRCHVDL